MSLDRSLKSKEGLIRSRSVLTRAERLKVLAEEERWEEGDSVFGLPKVRQKKKSSAGSKSKKEKTTDTDADTTEGTEASAESTK